MMNVNPQSAWLYLRKSRDEEREEQETKRDVLALHRSQLLDLAERDGVHIPETAIIAEIGSADEIDNRPGFRGLLSLWQRLPRRSGGVVYCTEISRLSRGIQSQQGLVQDILTRAGILIRTPGRYYDLTNEEDAFLFECQGLIARAELRNTKRRYQAAFAELTRKGRPLTGRAGFGYEWDHKGKTFIPVPEQFPILRAFLRDLRHMSEAKVAEKYGISRHIVAKAARNPVVCGWAVKRYGRHEGEKPWAFPYAALPREEWVWPEQAGDWEPAISRQEWEELQPIIDRRWEGREKHNSDEGWCRDVLQFAACPGRVRMGSHRQSGQNILTYEIEPAGGPVLYIPREAVHTAATDLLRAALGPDSDIPRLMEQRWERSLEAQAANDPVAAVAECERKLARLRAQLDNLTLRLADPDTDPEQLASLARVEKQIGAQLKAERSALSDAQRAAIAIPRLGESIYDLAALHERFEETWEEIPVHDRRTIAAACISLIEVTIGRVPGQRAWRREVTACVPADWLVPRMGRDWAVSLTESQSQLWETVPFFRAA